MQIRTAQSATLDSIPEPRNGDMMRSQTLGRALPPLQEPLLPEPHLVRHAQIATCGKGGNSG